MDQALRDQTCVVTGATAGIGRAIASTLATRGARVILVARSRERGAHAKQYILRRAPAARIEVVVGNLEVASGVNAVGEAILAACPRIDVLVNNAAVITGTRRELTADDVERTWATNVLAYHHLTQLLLGRLLASAPARIVNVASEMAHGLDLDDPEYRSRPYQRTDAYAQSKQADRMLTWALSRQLRGSGVVANAVNPGGARTELRRHVRGLRRLILAPLEWRFPTAEDAADTPVWVATAPELAVVSGVFFSERRAVPCPFRDPALLDRLVEQCERARPAPLVAG